MSSLPLSVVIPTYNRAHTLKRALDSVLGQSLLPQEIIVVDDGSQDHSAALLAQYQNQITVLRLNANHGVSFARNRGIEIAQNEWIAFLDSDDEWLPQKCAKQWALFLERPHLRVLHSDEMWIRHGVRVNPSKKYQKRGGWIFEHCLPLCAISPSTVMIHREVFARLGMFREDFKVCEDYDLWLKLSAQYEVGYVPEILIKKYGGHGDQLSQLKAMDFYRVQSLASIIQSGLLSETQMNQAQAVFTEKKQILRSGAEKHHNQELLGELERLGF